MYVILVTINKSLRCTVTIDSCVLIINDHTHSHIFQKQNKKTLKCLKQLTKFLYFKMFKTINKYFIFIQVKFHLHNTLH